MGYPKTYEVTGPVPVYDTNPGGRFTLEEQPMWKHDPTRPAFNEQAWVDQGLVKLVSEGAKQLCEVCGETGTKAAAKKEYTEKQLAEHYRKDHPAHEPPREG